MELTSGFSSLLLVVASYSNNETVVANYGVWGVVVVSTFGCQFMVPTSEQGDSTFNVKSAE